jgi:CcmD family protein
MNYLYASFTATWIIHIFYLISLIRGYARVRGEIEELDRK